MKEKFTQDGELQRSEGVRGIGSKATSESMAGVPRAVDPAAPWQAKAACKSKNPELFFPEGSGSAVRQQVEYAKAVCGSCEVMNRCLEHALVNSESFGIWGGLTKEQRKVLKGRAAAKQRSGQ